MKGRGKAQVEQVVILAHKIEWMARQKRLKEVDDYLKPKTKVSGSGVAQNLAKLEKSGLNVKVKRIERKD
jgi:hypothetical protein